MSVWIGLVVLAQFINAGVSLVEKFIISSGRIGKPIVMTFFVSMLSSLVILVFLFDLIPLPSIFQQFQIPSFSNIAIPTASVVILSLISAFGFIAGLYTLFSSYTLADVSDVVPVVNSVGAVVILILSFYFLDTSIATNFLWGFLFLVVGTFLIARFRFSKRLILYTLLSGLFFGINLICIKLLFNVTHFDDAFFWSRIAIVLCALLLLFFPSCHHRTVRKEAKGKKGAGVLFILLGNKVFAGIAGFMILKAIEIGDVAIVQALGGMQFVFLLLFAVLIGNKTSVYCGENCNQSDIIQKIVSVGIIVVGFFLLFI